MIWPRLLYSIWSDCVVYLRRRWAIASLCKANPRCRFDSTVQVGNCEFGKYVVLFDHVKMSHSSIGDYSYIQSSSRIFNCTIGNFCSIAAGVTIAPGIHDHSLISTHPVFSQCLIPLPRTFARQNHFITNQRVTIGHDVWIGEKAIILDGVTIGNGAVIGAGAVVTKNVAPYEIVGGIPARHLKFRFTTDIIEKIEQSQWWHWTEEQLETQSHLMLNREEFFRQWASYQK